MKKIWEWVLNPKNRRILLLGSSIVLLSIGVGLFLTPKSLKQKLPDVILDSSGSSEPREDDFALHFRTVPFSEPFGFGSFSRRDFYEFLYGSKIDDIDLIIDEMEPANIAYNTPENINLLNDRPEIKLILDTKTNFNTLIKKLDAEGKKRGQIIRTSPIMSARLLASKSDFEIEIKSPETQAITHLEPTIWRWRITPMKTGPLELDLSIIAVLNVNGEAIPREIKTFNRITCLLTIPSTCHDGGVLYA